MFTAKAVQTKVTIVETRQIITIGNKFSFKILYLSMIATLAGIKKKLILFSTKSEKFLI